MLGHVPLVVRWELRRRLRAVTDSGSRLVALVVGVVFGGLLVLAAIGGAFFAGRALAAGTVAPATAVVAAESIAVAVPLFTAGLVAVRAVQLTGVPAEPDGLLLAVTHREAVAAQVGVELLLHAAMVGVALTLGGVAFAIGSASPATALLVTVATLLLVALGTVAGFALGLVIRLAIARSRLLARFKTALGVAVFAGYIVVVTTSAGGDVAGPLLDVMRRTPLAWLGDLSLLAVLPTASVVRAAGGIVVTLVSIVLLGGATTRLAAALWYSTPVEPDRRTSESRMGPLAGLDRRTSAVVRKTWLRARRSPLRLVYVAYPLLFVVGPLATGLEGGLPVATVPVVALYGAWATGAAFTLNPIGDETPVLPVTVTSGVGGRRFVRALCFAGLLLGLPGTLALAIGVGLLASAGPVDLAFVAAVAVVLPVGATGLAVGVGAAFPRTEPARVTRSRTQVVPSLFAFAIYSVALFVLAAPVLVAAIPAARGLLADAVGSDPVTVGMVGIALTTAVLGVAATLSYRSAVATFDGYTVA